jgi:transposase InsO family protein
MHLRVGVVLAALEMAVRRRQPRAVIHHSDQGNQPGFKWSPQRSPF